MNYTPLYIKTDNSLLESLIKIPDLIKHAKEYGFKSLTITDRNMFGTMEFYNLCIQNDIKPIIGMEVSYNDLIVLLYAKDYIGYQNLIKLETINSKTSLKIDDFYKYSKSLICILPFESKSLYKEFNKIYEDIFLGYKDKKEYEIVSKVKSLYLEEVKTLKKEDTIYLEYLQAIKKGIKKEDVTNNYEEKYLKEDYTKYDYDLKNNYDFTSMIDIKIEKRNDLLPIFDTNGIEPFKYLKDKCKEGLKKRFGEVVPRIYIERLKYELDIINKMGFSNYFLVVEDYVNYAKENDILVGPGRGSAASSLVSYVLNITDIDPIKYNLLFERFLNPERITMPDIDVDFLDSRKEEVVKYCISKYGIKKTCGIITFGTLASKQAIRDVFRTLDIDSNIVSKMLSSKLSLIDNVKLNKELKKYLDNNLEVKKAYYIATKLEGIKRHTSVHAAGVVISNVDLDEVLPLYYHDDMYLTCYTMNYLEDLGLLKMDFLSLKNLNIIDKTLKSLKKDKIDIPKIPLNDDLTFKLLESANTVGIFQFESEGIKNVLTKFKPNSFEDIYALLALYRPGPMDNIDTYIRRKNNIEKVNYYDKRLEIILKPTYGILIYQEQIMQVANVMASYSLGEADILRRAMSKKKEDVLIKEKEKFINRAIQNGYSHDVSNEVYELILKFASYGFNKAHSVSYAMISYKMAYLKAHYKKYFLKTLLDMSIGSITSTKDYIYESLKNGVQILLPDINLSTSSYEIKENGLIFPLCNIKGISNFSNLIIEERKKGNFIDIFDFISRVYSLGLNKQIFINLILAGCFDSFNINRKTLIENIDLLINYGELSLDLGSEYSLKPVLQNYDEYSKRELTEKELEVFGFYLKNHPVLEKRITKNNNLSINSLTNYFDKNVEIILSVKRFKEIVSKKNENMGFVTFEDEKDVIDGVIFPKLYQNVYIEIGDIVLVNAHVEKRFDKLQLVINKIDKI